MVPADQAKYTECSIEFALQAGMSPADIAQETTNEILNACRRDAMHEDVVLQVEAMIRNIHSQLPAAMQEGMNQVMKLEDWDALRCNCKAEGKIGAGEQIEALLGSANDAAHAGGFTVEQAFDAVEGMQSRMGGPPATDAPPAAAAGQDETAGAMAHAELEQSPEVAKGILLQWCNTYEPTGADIEGLKNKFVGMIEGATTEEARGHL